MKKVLFFLALGSFLFGDPIKIAMDNQYPPFEFPDKSGNTIGFDVDLATEISKRVGFETQFIRMEYDSICKAINSKQADIGISAFGDDEATQDCDHSLSYFESEYILIKDKSRKDIKSIGDLVNKKVAYDKDASTMKDFLTEINATAVPKRSGTFFSTLLLLHEGKVDAILVDSCNAPILRGNTDFLSASDKAKLDLISGGLSAFAIFHEQPSEDSETFVIFPKDGRHEDLKNKINNAILQMRNDGTIPNLLKKYGLQ